MEQTAQNLEALEQKAERALEKAERGWREFAETLREIRETDAYRETGKSWGNYVESRWNMTLRNAQHTLSSYAFAAEMEEANPEFTIPPSAEPHYRQLRRFGEPERAADFWERKVTPQLNRRGGIQGERLRELVNNELGYAASASKVGVLERMEEQDAMIPEYPSGPTPEERAYTAASELLSAAMDVTPEAAADSISPGLADTVAKRYEALIPWTRRFVAQLHLRSGGSSAGGPR